MRTPEQIIQAYAMGLLMPGEVVSQMKDHYPGLNPVQIMNTINTILTWEHSKEYLLTWLEELGMH
jgi:hypothetical protein